VRGAATRDSKLIARSYNGFAYIASVRKPEFDREGKVFFFEKKKQKTFVCFGLGFS
jgi:hypothetical protein